ncbi:MAG: phosphatidate cytidylyltransferase [Sterolibacterium sp.]|nr:phosphatidate cytidylyltransferase [Sterolibacterium sp.]
MLKTRIITALMLAGGLLATLLLLPPQIVLLVFAGIVGLAAWEWAGLLKMSANMRLLYAAGVGTLCVLLLAAGLPLAWLQALWWLATVFWLLLVPFWFRARWPLRNAWSGWLVGVLLLVPTWAALALLYQRGAWWLLASMALVWVADTAAYFAGSQFGRHKLAPAISPGKTWEGALGAVVGVCLYGGLLAQGTGHLSSMSFTTLLLAGLGLLLLTAVSIAGDLFESLAKRQAGLKDSSALLPGHGGVLDRIDSLTSTLPLTALAVSCLLP